MSESAPTRMTADAFLAWAEAQEGRYELWDGEVIAMAPERARHNQVKGGAYLALRSALRAANLSCQAFTDGMAVRVDETTVFEPDASLRCGDPLDGDAVEIRDALVVVEVVSPSSRTRDMGVKLRGYFRIPALRHYLILYPEDGLLVHHARTEAGGIATAIHSEGALRLEPPGIEIALADLFAE